jgi:hypothetical protein
MARTQSWLNANAKTAKQWKKLAKPGTKKCPNTLT